MGDILGLFLGFIRDTNIVGLTFIQTCFINSAKLTKPKQKEKKICHPSSNMTILKSEFQMHSISRQVCLLSNSIHQPQVNGHELVIKRTGQKRAFQVLSNKIMCSMLIQWKEFLERES